MKNAFVIGTRGSKLALRQAESVRIELTQRFPEKKFRLEIIKTEGDKIQNLSLAEIGGRGVFTKELEAALIDERIDMAVHSLKDLPTALPEKLHIAAVLRREDARDALVARAGFAVRSIKDLHAQAVVATSSLRRAAQLKNLCSDVQIKDIRGNIDSRLRKLDAGGADAILLAVAGLKRLGFDNRISVVFDLEEMLPQVGQGALAIETRSDDGETNQITAILNDAKTFACVAAERAFLRHLGGGCQFPIAAFANLENPQTLFLRGLVAAPDGSQVLRGETRGKIADATVVGENLAQNLLRKGAANLINLRSQTPNFKLPSDFET
jgi:hydroxymethylbilane synthase